ncbi:MAG: hypothetical protein ACKO7B_18205 [Flavobacteriales bacterium]
MIISDAAIAQRKGDNQNKVTPETARKKEAEKIEQQESEYQKRKDHHLEVQDKATRKRMKKNLRKAQRLSWGKDVPWYKRWFRKH